jgi:hypothetical protein
MKNWKQSFSPQLRPALTVGVALTAALALLPYLRDFFVIARVVGALAAVAFALRWSRARLEPKVGAQLGFNTAFYGTLLASGIYDLVWKVFHFQLWKVENMDLIFGLFVESVRDWLTPSFWVALIMQIVFSAIFAGIFGAPAGLLGVKWFTPGSTEGTKKA